MKKILTDKSLQKKVLFSGRYEGMLAIPIGKTSDSGIEFEITDLPQKTRSLFSYWLESTRAFTITATFMPALSVILYGILNQWQGNILNGFLALLGCSCLQLGTNLMNDYEDHRRLIDGPGKPGGAGVIQKGFLTPAFVFWNSLIFFALGILLGLPSVINSPSILLPVAALSFIIALGYSGWPFYFKYKALGGISVLLACGPLLTWGMALATYDRMDLGLFGIGLFYGLLACGILDSNNLEDMEIDKASGSLTLMHLLGFDKAKWLLLIYYSLSIVLYFFLPLPGLCVLCLLPIGFLLYKGFKATQMKTYEEFSGYRIISAQGHLLAGLLLNITLLIKIFS